jgi:MFS family permease
VGGKRQELKVIAIQPLRRLLTAQMLSEVGDWATRGALQVVVYERTHSAVWSAAVVIASLLAFLGPGQALAAVFERFEKRAVMVGSDLLRAALFLSLLIRMPVLLLLVVVAIAGLATPVFEANRSVLLRRHSPEDLYPSSLLVASVISQSALVAGYLAGGWAVTAIGANGALTANALSFGLSGLLLLGLPPDEASEVSPREALVSGLALFLNDEVLRWVMLLLVGQAAGIVAVESVATPYVLHHQGLRPAWVGVTLASLPVGTLLTTTLIHFGTGPRRRLRRGAAVACVSAVLAFGVFLLDPTVPTSLVAFGLAGAALGCVLPCNTVLGMRVPVEIQGTAFALAQGMLMGAQGIGALVGGVLAATVDERFSVLCSLGFAAFVAAVLVVRPPDSAAFRRPVWSSVKSRATASPYGDE